MALLFEVQTCHLSLTGTNTHAAGATAQTHREKERAESRNQPKHLNRNEAQRYKIPLHLVTSIFESSGNVRDHWTAIGIDDVLTEQICNLRGWKLLQHFLHLILTKGHDDDWRIRAV